MPRSFDGVDDDIAFGSDASIDDIFAATPFTGSVGFWFNRIATGFGALIGKFNDATGTGWYVYFRGAGANHVLQLNHKWTVGAYGGETTTQFSATGAWRHCGVTYNGSLATNDAVIYIDGVAETVVEDSAGSVVIDTDATLNMVMGDTSDAAAPSNTIIAGLEISKTIWTQAQVLNQMRWGRAGGVPLIRHPLISDKVTNEGSGTANGTVTGATVVGFPRIMRPGCGGIG